MFVNVADILKYICRMIELYDKLW